MAHVDAGPYRQWRWGQADAGNLNARTELNEIRRLVVWPLLERRLNLLGIFGTYRRLNYGDTPVIESVRKVGELARAQANRGDVVFGEHVLTLPFGDVPFQPSRFQVLDHVSGRPVGVDDRLDQ